MLIYKDIIRCIKRYKIKAYLLLGGGSLAFIVFSTFFSSVIVGSQVTDLTNVTKYHAAGYKGQGVKCIIIDGDWAGWSTLKDQGIVKGEHAWDSIEYHTHLGDNYIGFGHGAGMIQAFHDMAPEAEIYLYNSMFFQADNIANTLNYFRTEGISLVSYSLNNTNIGFDFLTGNDTLTKNLDDYTGNSVTVCVIAGNYANNTSSFHLEKESGTNNMLFPNGTRNLDIVVSDAPAFDITITRSGFQRRLADYTYTLTNQSTGVQIEHNANQ
ncbi:MAG: hypothetical protein LBI80_05180, partial [Endomicrobium sp.]|nr:hypothetical protein [Endomicrobium sp.]